MRDVVEYCIKNEPKRPDFEQDCVADGSVRLSATGPDADAKSEEEKEAILAIRNKYYREHWHRTLLSLLRYKNPAVASMEKYSLLTLKADNRQQDPIFFHVAFVKPGKATYMVEQKEV